MIEIATKYNQIEETKWDIGAAAFFSRKHKKDLEWLVLGALQKLLIEGNEDYPTYAIAQEEPDFLTFCADNSIWAPVEIVEVLPPGYKRQEFHQKDGERPKPYPFKISDPIAEPFQPLRRSLSNKASKRYAAITTLAIYYDIGKTAFRKWSTPFQERIFQEHGTTPFEDTSTFRRVLIMSSDFGSLVELHPRLRTIIPDRTV